MLTAVFLLLFCYCCHTAGVSVTSNRLPTAYLSLGPPPQATSDGGGRGEGGTTTAIRKDRGIDESEEEEEGDEEFEETKAV